jgi:hypothetical protein
MQNPEEHHSKDFSSSGANEALSNAERAPENPATSDQFESLWDEKLPNGRTVRQNARALGLLFLTTGVAAVLYVWWTAERRHGGFDHHDAALLPFGVGLYLSMCSFISFLVWIEARKSRRKRLAQCAPKPTPNELGNPLKEDKPPSRRRHPG